MGTVDLGRGKKKDEELCAMSKRLDLWITLQFSSSVSGVGVFILVTPASSADAAASERGRRASETGGERARERPASPHTHTLTPHPEGIEVSAKHLHGY